MADAFEPTPAQAAPVVVPAYRCPCCGHVLEVLPIARPVDPPGALRRNQQHAETVRDPPAFPGTDSLPGRI